MSRPFKVGDIVNGHNKDGLVCAKRKPITDIIDQVFYAVGDYLFVKEYLTLVTSPQDLAVRCGVEPYQDQFTPWLVENLVARFETTDGELSQSEQNAGLISNIAILNMVEQ